MGIVMGVLVACGVRGVEQDARAVVLEYTVPDAVPEAGWAWQSEELLVGTVEHGVDHRVPVTVEWAVAKDAENCLRVQAVKLRRSGGPAGTEVYRGVVKPADQGCAMRDVPAPGSTEPVERFDKVRVSYCWRWNGAVNAAECAYQSGFSISADAVGLEGSVERPPPLK
jgi:hypothetical protein